MGGPAAGERVREDELTPSSLACCLHDASPSCPKQLRGKASIWHPPSLAIPRVGLPHSIPRYEVNRLPITSALPVEIRGLRPLIGLVSPGTERHGAVH
jgi:hypothetical protein